MAFSPFIITKHKRNSSILAFHTNPELAFSYVNDSIKKRVTPLANKCNSQLVFECDVKIDKSIDDFDDVSLDLEGEIASIKK